MTITHNFQPLLPKQQFVKAQIFVNELSQSKRYLWTDLIKTIEETLEEPVFTSEYYDLLLIELGVCDAVE